MTARHSKRKITKPLY